MICTFLINQQVGTILVISQKIALGLLGRGERSLHQLIDYTQHVLEDMASDFILSRGGWVSFYTFSVSLTIQLQFYTIHIYV